MRKEKKKKKKKNFNILKIQVAVTRSKEVPVFGPPIPAGATFAKSKGFVEFLLAKIINAEHAAHRSEKFATMATRTRQEYLKVNTIFDSFPFIHSTGISIAGGHYVH